MSDDKSKGYFDLSKALDEVRHQSFGAKDTAVAGLKLFGKGIFNAARFAVTEVIPAAVEQTAQHNARTSKDLLKRENLTDEQRDRLEKVRGKSEDYLEALEQKRREQEVFEAELAGEGYRAADAESRAIGDYITPVNREVPSQKQPESRAASEHKPVNPSDLQCPNHAPSEPLDERTDSDQSAKAS